MDTWRSVLILIAGGGLFSIVAYDLRVVFNQSLRLAIIEAFVVLGVLLWFITEALGAFRAITLIGLAVSWGIAGFGAAVIAARVSRGSLRKIIAAEFSAFRRAARSLPAAFVLVLAYLLVSALILGVIAYNAAPNTWDSMTYHLSRVMHWQQNQSLAFYGTAIQRQLYFGPWAEMAILHFQILAGSDRIANFVQWFAMLGCVVGASLLAERLGGSRKAQILAALATMTLPMGILQATSTQNDYVVALWCVCFTVFVLVGLEQGGSWQLVPLAGAALGLAIVTKVTAVIYVACIGIWFAVGLVRRTGLGAWKPLLILATMAILIAAPHSLRNYGLYGNPLGNASPQELGQYTNDSHTVPILASNFLRNIGIQLASPSEDLNRGIEAIIQKAHVLMGLDLNDPRATWHGVQFQVVFSMYEDSAGNPLHLLLVLGTILLLIRFRAARATIYVVSLAAGFLAFCFLLKWQPWNSRLNLPLLVLSMPLAAVVLSDHLPQPLLYLAALVLAVAAIPYLIANPTRPLVGANSIFLEDRLRQYFTNVPDDFSAYDQAARMLRDFKCQRIGLASPLEGREYLVWVTARAYSPETSVEHILVKNASRRFETDSTPCAIITTYPVLESTMAYHNSVYVRTIDTERFNLFLISNSAQ
jgi:hypothetical protein